LVSIPNLDGVCEKLKTPAAKIMRSKILFLAGITVCAAAAAQTLQTRPDDASLAAFKPLAAPETSRLLLKNGDRLAICGDSITEQHMYTES
jgi:hypothetical protein